MKKECAVRSARRWLAAVLLLCALLMLGGCGVRVKTIDIKEHLDETVLELDGEYYLYQKASETETVEEET